MGPLQLTQRQAGGKFSRAEASALIDRLLAEESGEIDDDSADALAAARTGEQIAAADRLARERAGLLSGMPADLMVAELERRGWRVTPPA